MNKFIYILAIPFIASCTSSVNYDAQGTFEATEVTISAEATGRIINFDIQEGATVKANVPIGAIDSTQLDLQRKQLKAQQSALLNSRPNKEKQVASLRQQIATQRIELQRIDNLLRDGAATQKQHDDIDAQIKILEQQLSASLSTIDNSTASINENAAALEAQIAMLDDRITKCSISASIDGTVLVKYAEAGEFTTAGKPLMKVADLNNIYLRAYFTSDQLANINLGDEVTVTANFGGDQRYEYAGRVAWISSKSEFTPKNIQTQDSRANMVYAVKIAVKNDGRLKIGLAGDVNL